MAMEQWALVRPPPAQTNHPLNVQVQLLLPYGVGGRSARTSTESTRSTHAESAISFDAVANGSISAPNISSQQASPRQQFALRRSSSVRSSASSVRSHRSSFSASTSSTAGGGGTSSGGQASKGRQTAPLYNFAFHAVLQNPQVTDAGTDAKVCKFLKQGIEIHELAVLDPVALGAPTRASTLAPELSGSSSVLTPKRSPGDVPLPAGSPASPSGLLGKLKRMSLRGGSANGSPSKEQGAQAGGMLSTVLSAATRQDSNMSLVNLAGQPVEPLLREDDLATQHEERERKSTQADKGYVWTVRRWLRRDMLPAQGGAVPKSRAAQEAAAAMMRVEWRKAPKQKRKKTKRSNKDASTMSDGPPPARLSTLSLASSNFSAGEMHRAPSPSGGAPTTAYAHVNSEADIPDPNNLVRTRGGRRLTVSSVDQRNRPASVASDTMPRSPSRAGTPNPGADGESQPAGSPRPTPPAEEEEKVVEALQEEADDDDCDSDPEDSDRTWTCEIVYGGATGDASEGSGRTTCRERRVLLGTLRPAPHHPKLIAQLGVPYALSPVPLLSAHTSTTLPPVLTVEEMKDIVACTSLWLVVHEGLGGLAKRRKGDGAWRFGGPRA